jgi:hypothetical protein
MKIYLWSSLLCAVINFGWVWAHMVQSARAETLLSKVKLFGIAVVISGFFGALNILGAALIGLVVGMAGAGWNPFARFEEDPYLLPPTHGPYQLRE